jgi:hypothetical protein
MSPVDHPIALAGLLNDLFTLDLDQLAWEDLTGIALGTPPAPRAGLGITSVSGRIFIFGGVGLHGAGLATHPPDLRLRIQGRGRKGLEAC